MNFDWVHLHLMVNHFPIVLLLLGAVASVVALIARRETVWTYAAITLLVGAVFAPVANFTGERAEHDAEERWYVSHETIHHHEEAAERANWAAVVTGILAALALWKKKTPFRLAMVALALVSSGLIGYAALEGGEIVHENPALERGAGGPGDSHS